MIGLSADDGITISREERENKYVLTRLAKKLEIRSENSRVMTVKLVLLWNRNSIAEKWNAQEK